MERKWWCLDCRNPVELNNTGRCGVCDSDAVDVMSETDLRVEALPVNEPVVSEQNTQPLFIRLGAFLRAGNTLPTSLWSSLLRPSSYPASETTTTDESTLVN